MINSKKIIITLLLTFFLASCQDPLDDRKSNFNRRNKYSSAKKNEYVSDKDKFLISKETIEDAKSGKLARKVTFRNGKYEGYFKIGKPYQIFGVTYTPKNYDNFEEIGTASWYGDQFNGKKTANGETYNKGSMTAAHPTLPLPSLVKVTNLKNNKSVIVRVNDRGPFAKNRVIDLSQKAAEILEYKNKGTTIVKIELLKDDTRRFKLALGI